MSTRPLGRFVARSFRSKAEHFQNQFRRSLPAVSATEVLNVQLRDQTGTTASVRLRRAGMVPAVLYGHGEENRHLSIPVTEVKSVLRHHSKMVTLQGAVADTALVSDVQFDHLGINVLHLDLVRVNLKEKIEVEVGITIAGESIGVRSGGILLENLHEVVVRCLAGDIPDSLALDVSDLDIGGHKTAGQLTLPPGVELVTPADAVVAHIEKPKGMADEPAVAAPAAPSAKAAGTAGKAAAPAAKAAAPAAKAPAAKAPAAKK